MKVNGDLRGESTMATLRQYDVEVRVRVRLRERRHEERSGVRRRTQHQQQL